MMIENDTPEPLTVIDGDISKTLSHYVTHPDLELRERFGDVLLEIIKEQPSDKILEHIHDLIASLFIVAEDKSNRVKHNLVDKIPDIFQQCHEHACPELENYLYDRLLQILFESLHDVYLIQAQAFIGILCILDKGFINPKKIEEKFCPVIISLLPKDYNHAADPESENVFKGAIMLLAVVSSEIGPEKTEEWFIDRFIDLCYCPVQSIQKSCIKSLPLISNVMGTSYTEAKLLDIFLALCNAENFEVRQECAEHIALMSIFCTPESRREKLSPAVIKLTLDDSKWVADSTFKTLGQFISTFADPPITGLGPCRSGAKMLNWADSDFKIEADSKLLANYEYYMRTFTEPDTPTNICHSQFNDEALNCEEIAQKLFKNKENLYQQINDDSYLKKSCIPCVDVGGNTISYTSNVIRNPIASPSGGRMEELVLDNNLSILQDGTDLNDLITENLDKNAPVDPDIFSTIDKEKEDKNILNSNLDCNSLNENSRLVVNEQQPKCRKRSELYFKRNTPSDLSLIIKQAINAGQEKLNPPPPPVVRQVSNEDSSLSNTFDKVLKIIQTESESTSSISSPSKKEQSPNNNKQQVDYSAGDYQKVQEKDEEDEAFNEFKYWYISPELPLDSELIEKNEDCKVTTYPPIKSSSFSNLEQQGTVSELVVDLDNNLIEIMMDITSSVEQIAYRIDKSDNSSDSSAQSIGVTNNEQPGDLYEFHTLFRCKPIEDIKRDVQYDNDNFELMTSKFKPPIDYEQDVIPPQILKAFVTMILYEADREITCAYDFPAVALTLGRRNWHLLKGLLQYLCDYINWKVRKTIASQIDWLALILGREIATQDLLPMYLGFFKDLDEVKIEAIKKAASFLKVVDPSKRDEVLSNFGICLRIDSKTNWRIKEDLARQIFLLVKMCDSVVKVDSLLYLTSLTGLLLEDKICCIREMAADAMVEIFHISNAAMQEAVMKIFLLQEFGLSGSWRKRQTFLSVVYKLLLSNPPLVEPFHLVSDTVRRLSNDPVSNIRLLIAKILVQLIKLDANILNETNEYDVEVMKILRKLSQDVDRDIRDVINVNIPIAEKIGRIKSEIDNQIESTRNHGLNAYDDNIFDMPLT